MLHFSVGVTPLHIFIWFIRLLLYLKAFWQVEHLNGVTLLWAFMCPWKWCFSMKPCLQIGHSYFAFPWWCAVVLCTARPFLDTNDLPHCSYIKVPVCLFCIWTSLPSASLKSWPHFMWHFHFLYEPLSGASLSCTCRQFVGTFTTRKCFCLILLFPAIFLDTWLKHFPSLEWRFGMRHPRKNFPQKIQQFPYWHKKNVNFVFLCDKICVYC